MPHLTTLHILSASVSLWCDIFMRYLRISQSCMLSWVTRTRLFIGICFWWKIKTKRIRLILSVQCSIRWLFSSKEWGGLRHARMITSCLHPAKITIDCVLTYVLILQFTQPWPFTQSFSEFSLLSQQVLNVPNKVQTPQMEYFVIGKVQFLRACLQNLPCWWQIASCMGVCSKHHYPHQSWVKTCAKALLE